MSFSVADQVASNSDIKFQKHIMLKFNALPPTKCEELISLCKLKSWAKSYTGTNLDSDYRSNYQFNLSLEKEYDENIGYWDNLIYEIFNTAVIEYQSVYDSQFIYSDEGYSVLRYEDTQKYDLHVDSGAHNKRLVSGLLYLNEDFQGGETDFPLQGVKVKPVTGSVCLFPSIFTHPHASLPITSGVKYVIVTWFKGF